MDVDNILSILLVFLIILLLLILFLENDGYILPVLFVFILPEFVLFTIFILILWLLSVLYSY